MSDQFKVVGPPSDNIGVADYGNQAFMLVENDAAKWSSQTATWIFKPSTDPQYNDLNPTSSFKKVHDFKLRKFNNGNYYAPYLCVAAEEGFAAVVPSFLILNPSPKIPTYWAQNITDSHKLVGIDLLSSGKIAVADTNWIRAYSPGIRNSTYVQTNISGINSMYSDINNDTLWVGVGNALRQYKVNDAGNLTFVNSNTMLDAFLTNTPINGPIIDIYPVGGREYLGDMWVTTANASTVIDGGNFVYVVNAVAGTVNHWDYPLTSKIDQKGLYAVTNSMNTGSVLKSSGGGTAHLIGPDATLTWPGGNFGMMRWWYEPAMMSLPANTRWDRMGFPGGI